MRTAYQTLNNNRLRKFLNKNHNFAKFRCNFAHLPFPVSNEKEMESVVEADCEIFREGGGGGNEKLSAKHTNKYVFQR